MRSSDAGTLGDVVRQRRLELGWSQEELAARVSGAADDVRQSDISRLELGKVGLPRRARLQRIAAALGMPLGELLARSGWAVASPPTPAALERVHAAPADLAPASAEVWRPVAALAGGPSAPRASAAIVRLQDAIAEARLTIARSAEALERARAVYARAANLQRPSDLVHLQATSWGMAR